MVIIATPERDRPNPHEDKRPTGARVGRRSIVPIIVPSQNETPTRKDLDSVKRKMYQITDGQYGYMSDEEATMIYKTKRARDQRGARILGHTLSIFDPNTL